MGWVVAVVGPLPSFSVVCGANDCTWLSLFLVCSLGLVTFRKAAEFALNDSCGFFWWIEFTCGFACAVIGVVKILKQFVVANVDLVL